MKTTSLHEFIIKLCKFLSLGGGIAILFYIWFQSEPNLTTKTPESTETNRESTSTTPLYDITLVSPLFNGFNKDMEPYTVKAHKAVKTYAQKYKFEGVEAEYSLEKIPYHINAKGGVLDDNSKWLYLNDGVKVYFNDFNLTSDEISINLHSKESYSNSLSIITFKDSEIVAEGYSSGEENNIIKFKGHVKTRIHLQDF